MAAGWLCLARLRARCQTGSEQNHPEIDTTKAWLSWRNNMRKTRMGTQCFAITKTNIFLSMVVAGGPKDREIVTAMPSGIMGKSRGVVLLRVVIHTAELSANLPDFHTSECTPLTVIDTDTLYKMPILLARKNGKLLLQQINPRTLRCNATFTETDVTTLFLPSFDTTPYHLIRSHRIPFCTILAFTTTLHYSLSFHPIQYQYAPNKNTNYTMFKHTRPHFTTPSRHHGTLNYHIWIILYHTLVYKTQIVVFTRFDSLNLGISSATHLHFGENNIVSCTLPYHQLSVNLGTFKP